MLKIKIAKTEIEYLNALETEEFYNGANCCAYKWCSVLL